MPVRTGGPARRRAVLAECCDVLHAWLRDEALRMRGEPVHPVAQAAALAERFWALREYECFRRQLIRRRPP